MNKSQIPTAKTLANRRRRRRQQNQKAARRSQADKLDLAHKYNMFDEFESKRVELGVPRKMLSPCAMDYLKAIYAPFGSFKTEPCVPSLVVLPSFKFNSFARGTFSIGTLGVGFVAMNALNPICMDAAGNPAPNISFTNNAFVLNTMQYVPTVGVQANFPSSSTLSAFANTPNLRTQQQYRLVGAGVKARFLGNTFDATGEIICYRNESNASILAGTNNGIMLAQRRAVRYPTMACLEKWAEVCYFPDNADLLGFQNLAELNNHIALQASANLALFITGGTPGATWQYETTQWWECVGESWPSLTQSISDTAGMTSVLGASPVQLDKHQPGLLGRILSTATELLPYTGTVGKVAGAAIRTYNTFYGAPRETSLRNPLYLGQDPINRGQGPTISDFD